MPLPQKWNKKRKKPPAGFDYVEPILESLENELRDVVKDVNLNKRKQESMWPIHQINWQKSRYIYDMFYQHHKISRQVYQYCIDQKLVDAALIAKWKKPGYERLCSTYVINPANYKFGTTSICRVPYKDRNEEQKLAKDPTTGCMGCASGAGAGPRNIFGNKYGQSLAAVQIARERRMQLKREREEAEVRAAQAKEVEAGDDETDDDDDAETDDSDDDGDYGPSPAAGIWAGSQKLEQESEKIAYDDAGDEETDDDDDEGPQSKKARSD